MNLSSQWLGSLPGHWDGMLLMLLMLPDVADKMLDDHGPVYLVRCTGTHEGAPCPALVALELSQKTECPVCGALHGPWTTYLAGRTQTKTC